MGIKTISTCLLYKSLVALVSNFYYCVDLNLNHRLMSGVEETSASLVEHVLVLIEILRRNKCSRRDFLSAELAARISIYLGLFLRMKVLELHFYYY